MLFYLICRPRYSPLIIYPRCTTPVNRLKNTFRTLAKKASRHDTQQSKLSLVESGSQDGSVPIRYVEFDIETEQHKVRAKRKSVEKAAKLSWSGSRAFPSSYFTQTWSKLLAELTGKPDSHVRFISAVRAKKYISAWEEAGEPPPHFDPLVGADIRFGRVLPWLLAGTLVAKPRSALKILDNLPWLPRDFTTRADCLIYLREHWWHKIKKESKLLQGYQRQNRRLQDPSSWPKYGLSTAYFQQITHELPADQGQEIAAECLKRCNSPSVLLLLYIVDYCTKISDVDGALDAMARLPPEVLQSSELRIMQRCTKLLMQDSIETVDGTPRFKILTRLLELGIRPDAVLHKMVVVNAIYAQLPTVAWDLFRYTRENQIEISPRAHLLLLKDAFQSHDTENLNTIMSAIHEQESLAQDPKLVGYTMNMLRVLYRDDTHFKSEDATARLLAIYDRAYNRSPLAKLKIAPGTDSGPSQPNPEPLSLGYAVWAYALMQHDESQVYGLWDRFRAMVENGDASMIALARHDILYNAVIKFSDRSSERTGKIAEVLEYMLQERLCLPTPLTWSLILCAYLRHKQHEAASAVWQMARQSDICWRERDWQHFLQRNADTQIAQELRDPLVSEASEEVTADSKTSSNTPDVGHNVKVAVSAQPGLVLSD